MQQDGSAQRFGAEFEEEVRIFLRETLGFSDVNGGPDFHIAPEGEKNQIDACGRFDDVLFIFECTAAGRTVKRNLRDKILETQTRADIALSSYKRIPEYEKCNAVRFVFITKKIEIPDTEKEYILHTNNPPIFYADEKLLEYYTDLKEKVGKYAIFSFLADFKVRPTSQEEFKVLTTATRLGNYLVYNFFADPKKLLPFAYVARRRSQKEDFYQRMLDKSRIKKIQEFLDSGGIFPTNVIISLKDGDKSFEKINAQFAPLGTEVGILTIKNSYNACWIVDGQHRLYSYASSSSDTLIPCIAFDEISIEEERKFFLEINKEQKPIQADLIWDLEGLSDPDSPRGVISNAVRTLDGRHRSPFFGKIFIPVRGSKNGKIVNMAAFCNGISNAGLTKQITTNCLGIQNPLYDKLPPRMTKRTADVLERYFSLLSEELNEEQQNFVFGNAGVPILLYVLEPIVARVGYTPSSNDLEPYTRAIAAFFQQGYGDPKGMKELKRDTNSEGARKNLAKQIGLYIRRELHDPDFWPQMEEDESVEEIIKMERRIGAFISAKLSAVTSAWSTQLVPQDISRIAKRRAEQDGTSFDENLSLGDELQIVMTSDNWNDVFKKIFIQKDAFVNVEEVKIAFGYLSKIRNPGAHGKTVTYNKSDLRQCDLYLQKLYRVIPETTPED
jgi:DGQHR domain-containing protein